MPSLGGFGGYARHAGCAPQQDLVSVPARVDPADTVSLAFNYIIAFQMLTGIARFRADKPILVHRGAGGVGARYSKCRRRHRRRETR
jgi:NADPH:quinone reductase